MSSSTHDPLTSSPASAKASSSSYLPSSSNANFSAHDSALSLTDPTSDPSSIAIADPSNVAHYDHDVAQHEPEEEEELFDDGDSAFGGSLIGCDTDTLASYITDYRYENGRRYHAYQDGEYWVRYFSSEGLDTRFMAEILMDYRVQTTNLRMSYRIWRITCTS